MGPWFDRALILTLLAVAVTDAWLAAYVALRAAGVP